MRFRSLFAAFLNIVLIAGLGAGLFPAAVSAQDLSPQERAQLQAEYDQTMKEINELQGSITTLQAQGKSLKGDISLLTAQIAQKEATLKQKAIVIKQLSGQISQKTAHINDLTSQINQGKETLAELMRKTQEIDDSTVLDVMLSNKNVSDFFADLDSFNSIQRDMQTLFDAIQTAKSKTETERASLTTSKNQQEDAKYAVETEKKQIATAQSQKQQLLTINNSTQAAYQTVLAQKQARADAIRAALFDLRDTQGIQFGTALQYANEASRVTGVRPALILAILSQESDLGKNVGSCYVKDLSTGDGVGKNSGTIFQKVMKSPRDTDAFSRITSTLSLPWSTTPVSCPLGATYTANRGYGGAMGPSQFIPSTWELFQPRISSAIGGGYANPWDARAAIMATALYMSDLGAGAGGYTAESNAACKYYSGRSCDNKKPANSFYGSQVLQKAESIQSNIDFLKSV